MRILKKEAIAFTNNPKCITHMAKWPQYFSNNNIKGAIETMPPFYLSGFTQSST